VTDSLKPPSLLEQRLGLPIDPVLLEQALTHRSFSYENGHCPTNERLEFLGDSVLGVVVTSTLYHTHPDLPEGQLAKFRSHVVSAKALAAVGRELGLGDFLRLGKGEEATGGRDKSSILADAMEALLGAVYLDHDLDMVGELIHRLFDGLIEASAGLGAGLDWKTSLQELTAEHSLGVPVYLVDEEGPEHDKSFTARVRVADHDYPSGQGRSKKIAEQIAAEHAYSAIRAERGSVKAAPDASGERAVKSAPSKTALSQPAAPKTPPPGKPAPATGDAGA
jgi:ribonuclease III